jgi:hypothetical protein
MKRWPGIFVLATVCITPLASIATAENAPAGDAAVAAVERLEHVRRDAMVAVDVDALARIFDAGATYVHSTGLVQSRDDVLGMLTRGDIRYVAFEVESVAYRGYGSTVVGSGVQRIELTSSGKPFKSYSRYTVVYAVVHGSHKLVAYQSTPMPQIVKQESVDGTRSP